MRRRALIVAYNFPPNAAVGTMRTLRLVEQLAREDWEVDVLTATDSTHLPSEPVDPDLVRRVPPAVRVVTAPVWRPLDRLTRIARRAIPRVTSEPAAGPSNAGASTPEARNTSLVRRGIDLLDVVTSIPDSESGWIVPATARGFWMGVRRRPDVMYSTAPSWSTQVIAYALARLLRCRWVADFRDPWSRAPWRADRSPLIGVARRSLERLVVERADVVVFNTRRARDEFAAFYGAPVAAKLRVVANGCDVGKMAPVQPPVSDRFVLLHAGTLYGARSPLVLMRAIASAIRAGAIDGRKFRLRLLGAAADPVIAAAAADLGLADIVEFAPRVPRRESLQEIASASALLLLQQGHPLSVPAKTYEYIAAGRPILALADDGETATVVRESGLGVVVGGDDVDTVEQGLLRVMEMASSGVTRPARSFYDGAERARELAAVVGGLVPLADGPAAAGAVAPSTESRHA